MIELYSLGGVNNPSSFNHFIVIVLAWIGIACLIFMCVIGFIL